MDRIPKPAHVVKRGRKYQLYYYNPDGCRRRLSVGSDYQQADRPADIYSLYQSWGEKTDADGITWRFETQYDGPYPRFEVHEGKVSDFRFGSPFLLTVEAVPAGPWRRGQPVQLVPKVTCAGGKHYRIKRNGTTWEGDVALVVADREGSELANYRLPMPAGYRASRQVSVWFTVPADAQGPIVVTPSLDLGPFGVEAEELTLEVE